jgi:RNA polymerase sigma-70 factor (ECF subfamily)
MEEATLDTEKMSDIELVRRTAQRDESAFEELIAKYEDRVYNTVYRYLGDETEAEDVAQEVFVRIWKHARSFRGRSSFSTWLYRVVVNQCLNHRRKRRMDVEPLDSEKLADQKSRSPEAEMERRAEVLAVRRAVEGLPGRQRLALILAKYEGKSYKDIASIMGVSVPTVESLIHRARATLRKRLLPLREDDKI